jgi:chromate reductase
VASADALLLATPEYNHTIPGVMGNVVDWLSRRLPTSPLRDKPIATMGAALVALREVSLLASPTSCSA